MRARPPPPLPQVPAEVAANFGTQGFDSVESVLEAKLTETDLRELGCEQMR